MNKRNSFTFTLCCLILSVAINQQSFAWGPDRYDHTTHTDITAYAAEQSVLSPDHGNYLRNLGFTSGLSAVLQWDVNNDGVVAESEKQKVIGWLSEVGAKLEDGNARELNHFHNPLKAWSSAGYGPWESAIIWSQDSSRQATWGSSGETQSYCPPLCLPDNSTPTDWSWQTTRSYFYSALTSTVSQDREAYFAKTFRGVGHQMHLLQDMSVPMHVRNDPHPFNRGVERWVADNIGSEQGLKDFFTTYSLNPTSPNISLVDSINGLVPVARLFDTGTYLATNGTTSISMSDTSVGLAEWTNSNFFSDDTINLQAYGSTTDFPYPNRDNTNLQSYLDGQGIAETIIAEDGIADTGIWIKKINTSGAAEIGHFAKLGYTTNEIARIHNDNYLSATFFLDDECYRDYAEKLLPRAIGYSTGLLNYFFRGTLDVIMPDRIVYGIADGSADPQQFTTIKANVKNTTPNEAMGAGTLVAVARYKIRGIYEPDLTADPPTSSSGVPFSYSVSAKIDITSLPTMTQLTFDFSQNPIPAGITDLDLSVIFKGTLGNEIDTAVAVGREDLYEPMHLTIWNSTDRFYLDNVLRTREEILNDPALLARVDHNGDGSPDERINRYNVRTDLAFASDPIWAEPYQVTYYSMPPGTYGRLLLLADTEFWIHARRETSDIVAHSLYMVYDGVVNAEYGGTFYGEQVYDFRGILQHGWLSYAEYYPDNTDIWLAPWPVAADPTPYPIGYIRQ